MFKQTIVNFEDDIDRDRMRRAQYFDKKTK
jgi:hypothetical protein